MSGIFTTIEQDFHLTTAIFTPLSLQYFPTLLDFISQREIVQINVSSPCTLMEALNVKELIRKFVFISKINLHLWPGIVPDLHE